MPTLERQSSGDTRQSTLYTCQPRRIVQQVHAVYGARHSAPETYVNSWISYTRYLLYT